MKKLLAFALTAALALSASAPAFALPTKFKGKQVVILVRGAANESTLYLWGVCTDMDETGIWIDQTHLQLLPASTIKGDVKDVYMPWANVTYVKPDLDV